jgi:hypothetical protein
MPGHEGVISEDLVRVVIEAGEQLVNVDRIVATAGLVAEVFVALRIGLHRRRVARTARASVWRTT